MDEPQTERRKTDDLVLIMATKIETMSDSMVEMRGTMKELVNAITKLAVVEERQAQGSLALERAFKVIEKMESKIDSVETRIDALEKAAPMTTQTNNWVMGGVWGFASLVGALAMSALARKLGLA